MKQTIRITQAMLQNHFQAVTKAFVLGRQMRLLLSFASNCGISFGFHVILNGVRSLFFPDRAGKARNTEERERLYQQAV